MRQWIKKHGSTALIVLVTIGLAVFMYACEPKVKSLNGTPKHVSRAELQVELDGLLALAEVRMLSLDKQEQWRSIVLQNALVLVQGQPLNPIGIITAIAGIYGLKQAGSNVTKVVKETIKKAKDKNGNT